MRLRNAHLAVVERQKIVDYLLNAAHPDNSGKGPVLRVPCFSIEEPERLITEFRAIAESGEVVESTHSIHGEKYVVEGRLRGHTEGSRQRLVRTVWIIDSGREAPRLVTAYPGKE